MLQNNNPFFKPDEQSHLHDIYSKSEPLSYGGGKIYLFVKKQGRVNCIYLAYVDGVPEGLDIELTIFVGENDTKKTLLDKDYKGHIEKDIIFNFI